MELKIKFGADQVEAVDAILSDLSKQRYVEAVLKNPDFAISDEGANMVYYSITFKQAYGLYLFGWRQRGAFDELIKEHNNSKHKF